MSIFSILGKLIEPIGKVIDDVTTTTEEKLQARAKLAEATKEVELAITEYATSLAEQQAKIILSEAQGSWMQRNWRPCLMFLFGIIIANTYLVIPWLNAFGWAGAPVVLLPDKMWTLLTVGVGGYVAGRSGEQIMKTYKNSK